MRAFPPFDRHLAGVVSIEDVTLRRRRGLRTGRISRMKAMKAIAMNLAHEVRGPMGSIAQAVTALEDEWTDDPALTPLIAQLADGLSALEHLLTDTLEFAHPWRIALTRVSLKQLLWDTLAAMEQPLADKAIELRFDHDYAPEAEIAGDPEALRKAFKNLITNALEAMAGGETLTVGLSAHPDGGWTIVIKDEGVGIPPEIHDRLFDPFFTTKPDGAGMGLSIAHRILAAHGAEIEIASQVTAGTTVRLFFPESEPLASLLSKS